MSTPLHINPLRVAGHIGRGVFIELLRKKDVYVLGLLVAVFCVGALCANWVGIENPATGTFLLNLGLTQAYIFTHLLTLLLAGRQIPAEIDHRTIYPILARPLDRIDLLAGKWAACTLCGYGSYLIFSLLVWGTVPKLEPYSLALLGQHLVLQFFSLGLTAALALTLSLITPKALVALLTAAAVFAGHMIKGIIISVSGEGLFGSAMTWMLNYLPDFSKFQLTTRYTDGMEALAAPVFMGLIVYGMVYITGLLTLGHFLFRRRPL